MKITREHYTKALSKNQSLSEYLDANFADAREGELDVFQTAMKEQGIKTKTYKHHDASNVAAFMVTSEAQALFPEFVARSQREESNDEGQLYKKLVGAKTVVDATVAQIVQLDYGKDTMKRVAEAAELPDLKLHLGGKSVHLYKYGRKLTASYEAVAALSIEKLRAVIRRVMAETDKQKVADLLKLIVKGADASEAAEVVKAKTYDATVTAGNLTELALLNFLYAAERGSYDTLIVGPKGLKGLMPVLYPEQRGMLNPVFENLYGSVSMDGGRKSSLTVIYRPDADALIEGGAGLIALDSKAAVEEFVQRGAQYQEYDRFITNQTHVLTVSDTVGFAKGDLAASKVLLFK